jgi:hypothetical protein
VLYLDTDTQRQLSRERTARLAADYRQAQRGPRARSRRLDLLRPRLARLTRLRVRVSTDLSVS